MKKGGRIFTGILAACVFAFSALQLMRIYLQKNESAKHREKIKAAAVTEIEAAYAKEDIPIKVDFEKLREKCPDISGWLYMEGTKIDFPVVKYSDNEYYLRRLTDGTWNMSGTPFIDFRNTSLREDKNTVIYGHNMKDDTMFSSLLNFKEQEFYDEHPELWLLTPDGNFKVKLVSGNTIPSDHDIYKFPKEEDLENAIIRELVSGSDFKSSEAFSEEAGYLTLSTCSYDYENARYVLTGVLEEIF